MQKPPLPHVAGTQLNTLTVWNTIAEAEVLEEAEESNTIATQEDIMEVPRTSRECHNTTSLPFLDRRKRPVADEQFGKFVEVIKMLYDNIPLLDAMKVPTYAKYI